MELEGLKIVPQKGHYEPVNVYTKEQPIFDNEGNQIGTETVVTGREMKWVWTDEEELEKHKLIELRTKREPLLEAFDKWEKAVLRGREQDDYIIMSWYNDLKDLKETAFKKVPERIQYYI